MTFKLLVIFTELERFYVRVQTVDQMYKFAPKFEQFSSLFVQDEKYCDGHKVLGSRGGVKIHPKYVTLNTQDQ